MTENQFTEMSNKVGQAVALVVLFHALPKKVLDSIDWEILQQTEKLLLPDQEEIREKIFDLLVQGVVKRKWSVCNALLGYEVVPSGLKERFIKCLGSGPKVCDNGDVIHIHGVTKDEDLLNAVYRATELPFSDWSSKLQYTLRPDSKRREMVPILAEMCARTVTNLEELYQLHLSVKCHLAKDDPVHEILRATHRKFLGELAFDDGCRLITVESLYPLDILEVILEKASRVDEFVKTSLCAFSYASRNNGAGMDVAVHAMVKAHAAADDMTIKSALRLIRRDFWKGAPLPDLQNLRAVFPKKAADMIHSATADVNWSALLNQCASGEILEEFRPDLQKLAFQKLQEQFVE